MAKDTMTVHRISERMRGESLCKEGGPSQRVMSPISRHREKRTVQEGCKRDSVLDDHLSRGLGPGHLRGCPVPWPRRAASSATSQVAAGRIALFTPALPGIGLCCSNCRLPALAYTRHPALCCLDFPLAHETPAIVHLPAPSILLTGPVYYTMSEGLIRDLHLCSIIGGLGGLLRPTY